MRRSWLDWLAGRNVIYQLAALTIGLRLAVATHKPKRLSHFCRRVSPNRGSAGWVVLRGGWRASMREPVQTVSERAGHQPRRPPSDPLRAP